MEGMNTSYQLMDVFITDLTPLGCSLVLDGDPDMSFPSREYGKGFVVFEGTMLPAEVISFVSGNAQIRSISGEKAQELYQLILARQQKRRFPLALRKLNEYLFYMLFFSIGTLSFVELCHLRFRNYLFGFLLLMVVRVTYTLSRNLIK
jgi:hypothetical protein